MKKLNITLLALVLILMIPSYGQEATSIPKIESDQLQPIKTRNESNALVCSPVTPTIVLACYAPAEPAILKQDDWQIRKPLVFANAYNNVEGSYLWKSRIMNLGFTGSEYRYYDYPQIRN